MTTTQETRWIGVSAPRREDAPLIRGRGRFIADVEPAGTLHMAVLRSPFAHARIAAIDTSAAESLDGVHCVLTSESLEGIGAFPTIWRLPGQKESNTPALAPGKARYVGEPVAAVVADSRYLAEDALDLIDVDYDVLDHVVDVEAALADGAPVINEDMGDNTIIEYTFPGINALGVAGDIEAAFADADEIVSGRLKIGRYSGVPLETRGLVAEWDDLRQTLTLHSESQVASLLRTELAAALGIPETSVRILTPNIGGAFGNKWDRYPEDILVSLASMKLDRPVKWIEDRREALQATVHGREQLQEWQVAAKADGTVLGVRGRVLSDQGAHLHSVGIGPAWVTGAAAVNQYKVANYHCDVVGVATNKTPNSTFRGFGGPEGIFGIERMMDKTARQLGIDPAELRRRNMIQADEFPYFSPAGAVYDSGSYPEALDKALEAVDYDSLREEQKSLREQGVCRGIGIASYIHVSGFGPSAILGFLDYYTGGYEGSTVKIDPHGRATLYTGMIPMGQGTETTLAQVAADQLEIDISNVRVVWGDTDQTPYTGFGSAGSRSNVAAVAVIKAIEEIKAKAVRIGAGLLEADPEDVAYSDGRISVKGAEEMRSLTLAEVAQQAYWAHRIPEGDQPGLEASYVYDPANFTTAFGTHVAVVDVDTDTGKIDWVKYVVVDDAGTIINPLLVEGQIHGALAQGLGGAMLEEFVYDDETGQLLSSTLMDYLLPSFTDLPDFEIHHMVTPSPHTEGGFKGMGEAGCFPAGAALANAVTDALSHLGVEVDQTPVTPSRLWTLIDEATG
ncbi:MAG: xanthine dehydrogenase family protein molybdopterin-binding subunit [bacterium]|nr:xanthine dehydrogenase family protein molybdopterin-binding subunit [bacterium]MDE0289373.1 xanthine dehydrogenase family protein molybdopterin-binding subunit [bacterium]MDE0439443.1 xanthine dehydrogenase family protein molybdopterin-binding subunit [bacterium]